MAKNDKKNNMSNIFLFSTLLVFFLSAGAALAQDHNGPRIEVREMRYDFGKVPQGEQATHIFQVRNAGNEPLVIDRVVPS